ncbi:MAG: hypothetical protein PWQ22_584 [Archaeoglobaceae archaeon]|nr:hypothetical protein [Archaeoglobaceae archaeon]
MFDRKYFEDKKIISHEVLTEVDWVRKFLVGKTVLDVACGVGRLGYLLEYYGYDITYTDISRDALKSIWWSEKKICGDFISYDFGNKKFDNVISFQFIEHLNDEQIVLALKKMKKLVRYRIINVTPHPNHIEFKKDPTHVYRPYKRLVELYLSVLPNTRIYSFDNKFRGNPKAWIRGLFEKLRPHYFENLIFVTEVR